MSSISDDKAFRDLEARVARLEAMNVCEVVRDLADAPEADAPEADADAPQVPMPE